MTFLGRLLVGFVVSFVLLCIFAGGVQQAGMVLVLSVVCTAGIGLVVWIPLWWAVGAMVLGVVGLFGAPAHAESGVGVAPVAPQTDLALKEYIRKASATGMDPNSLAQHLQRMGWSKQEIQKARQAIAPS